MLADSIVIRAIAIPALLAGLGLLLQVLTEQWDRVLAGYGSPILAQACQIWLAKSEPQFFHTIFINIRLTYHHHHVSHPQVSLATRFITFALPFTFTTTFAKAE